jgi:hypothetical protein
VEEQTACVQHRKGVGKGKSTPGRHPTSIGGWEKMGASDFHISTADGDGDGAAHQDSHPILPLPSTSPYSHLPIHNHRTKDSLWLTISSNSAIHYSRLRTQRPWPARHLSYLREKGVEARAKADVMQCRCDATPSALLISSAHLISSLISLPDESHPPILLANRPDTSAKVSYSWKLKRW